MQKCVVWALQVCCQVLPLEDYILPLASCVSGKIFKANAADWHNFGKKHLNAAGSIRLYCKQGPCSTGAVHLLTQHLKMRCFVELCNSSAGCSKRQKGLHSLQTSQFDCLTAHIYKTLLRFLNRMAHCNMQVSGLEAKRPGICFVGPGRGWQRFTRRQAAALGFTLILVLSWSAQTVRRNLDWADEETLFRAAHRVQTLSKSFVNCCNVEAMVIKHAESVILQALVSNKSRSKSNACLEVDWNQTQIWLSERCFAGVTSTHIADTVVTAGRLAGEHHSNLACV